MPDSRFCLLDEPLLSADLPDGGREAFSLPEVLARLGAGVDLEFSALQPHQFHAWYAFLVQLATLALDRAGETGPPAEPQRWKDLLLTLSGGQSEPWCLVVEDLSKPAFFQSPVPEGKLDVLKKLILLPDGIDVLVTAKNHDVKAERIIHPRPEHWVYALLCLQTMEGFLGAGNYGVSRMNGGFASRPTLAAAPGLAWSRRWRRDVDVCLESRPRLVEAYEYRPHGGHALLWLLPWDGSESVGLRDCDPFYLEICRRVRLIVYQGGLAARAGSSKTARVAAKESKGNTGDVWTPVRSEDGASLTVSGEGFTYKLMQDVLFTEDYKPGAALLVREGDGTDPVIIALCLVRGQGKTEGLRERILPVSRKVRSFLMSSSGRLQLGTIAKKWIGVVGDVQKRVLRPALCMLLQGGPDQADLRDDRAWIWSRRLEEEVDAVFFERLWAAVDRNPEEADTDWIGEVLRMAERLLHEAMHSVPLPSVRRYKAMARAQGLFYGAARNRFGEAGRLKGANDAA